MPRDVSLASLHVGWFEHGVDEFTHHIVACDASVAVFDDEFLAASGAAVSEIGEWWAWRAFVRYDGVKEGAASYWAEYVTLVLTVNRVRRGIVMCDAVGAVSTVSHQLVGIDVSPGKQNTFNRIAIRFGRLPRVDVSHAKKVLHVGRADNELHRRAHHVAGHVRRAEDGIVDTRYGKQNLVEYCDDLARGIVDN